MTQIEDTPAAINAAGRTIYVLEDDPRGQALIDAGGNLNAGSLAMWDELLQAGSWDLVVDIGANYGEMLLGVDLPPRAHVVAFEPDPRIRACLDRSVDGAGLAVEVRGEAVSAQVGEARFITDLSWSGTSRLATSPVTGAGEPSVVATTTLDACFIESNAKAAVIKIDVEGAEDLVLEGGTSFLSRLRDVALLVEIAHRSPAELVDWSTHWRMYVFDLRSREFIRVLPGAVEEVERLLAQHWIYRQDAVLRPRGRAA
jgi:FkbM family methyltransferase